MKYTTEQVIDILANICYFAQDFYTGWYNVDLDCTEFQTTSYIVSCFLVQHCPEGSRASIGVDWNIVLNHLGEQKSLTEWKIVISKIVGTWWG